MIKNLRVVWIIFLWFFFLNYHQSKLLLVLLYVIFHYYTYFTLQTLSPSWLYGYDITLSNVYKTLSSLALNVILMNFSVNVLCTSLLIIFCNLNIFSLRSRQSLNLFLRFYALFRVSCFYISTVIICYTVTHLLSQCNKLSHYIST